MIKQIPLALAYDDVLLVPGFSTIKSRDDVDLQTSLTKRITLNLPFLSANMSDVTGVDMAIDLGKLGGLGVLPRFMSYENEAEMVRKVKKEKLTVAAAIGIRNGFIQRAEALVKAGADVLFLDVAHGHMLQVIEATKKLKSLFGSQVDIVSGNVATYEGASDLFRAGADSVKVGVGPGSVCTTRIETGSGVPQITAVLETARAARKNNKNIICDGGIKNTGDIVKALAAGASAVMMGNQFAGTDKAPGKLVTIKGKKYKQYHGSTSLREKNNHLRVSGHGLSKNYAKQIEGVGGLVPFKGSLVEVVETMAANLRSGFSYSGAKDIGQLWKNAKFVRITSQGKKESGAHDLIILDK